MGTQDFPAIHSRLRAMLERYVPPLFVTADGPTGIALDLAPEGERETSTWFGATRVGARYVSYYLMPVYIRPSLLDGISPELRRRMQGKSCFNFATIDEALFAELENLTRIGFEATGGDPHWAKASRAGS